MPYIRTAAEVREALSSLYDHLKRHPVGCRGCNAAINGIGSLPFKFAREFLHGATGDATWTMKLPKGEEAKLREAREKLRQRNPSRPW